MTFQGFSVVRNCLRPETAPSIILIIKRGLLRNFAKLLRPTILQDGFEIFNYY